MWTPDKGRVESSAMFRFMQAQGAADYDQLHRWSVEQMPRFWEEIAEFGDLRFVEPASRTFVQPGDITTACFFEGATLNFAAHILRHSGRRPAIVFRGENGAREEVSFDDLRRQVAAFAAGLERIGVGPGDRVAGFVPNCPEAIVAMLGATSVGAIWSSCSPDFGINGVVDRFGQIEPRVLVCADGYFYNGKQHDSLAPVRGVLDRIASVEKTIVIPFTGDTVSTTGLRNAVMWEDFVGTGGDARFEAMPFDHPVYIMYSSGTTGVPKCIVHGAGGTAIQHLKEQMLHCDIGAGDRLFFFTTCGWMMWNWLVSALAVGTTIYLYDGSPFAEDGRVLWRLAAEERVTAFGSGAKFISATEKAGVNPGREFDLSTS